MDDPIPLYRKLSSKIKELKALGMTNVKIAKALMVSRKTILKSFLYPKDNPENVN